MITIGHFKILLTIYLLLTLFGIRKKSDITIEQHTSPSRFAMVLGIIQIIFSTACKVSLIGLYWGKFRFLFTLFFFATFFAGIVWVFHPENYQHTKKMNISMDWRYNIQYYENVIGSFLVGALIALMYFSPIKEYFQ